ncbi:amidase family protein [Propylenella binzhouense]|uniref:Amidase n=1 Tax=Propylenella binzhouense TaxID=2555902 RepID=A0A964WU31_9HYPH|nr:amidase family protein [Propylenella binzhouense]MYZ48619.1 amidase [Propylenella binzhouense]
MNEIATVPATEVTAYRQPFQLEEATIDEMHAAIRAGEITVVQIVQHYIDRAGAFNGCASLLVTEDGAPVPQVAGAVRATAPLQFPTETVKASDVLPDLDRYKGPPLEFGRMEATASDPGVHQQYGMIVGKPDAGQVNALATLNIRGERSVTCRGDFDRHPDDGPLPPGAPAVAEIFRRYPDALEQAAALDAEYGCNPDLEKLPLYGVVFSFKDPFDTKDMRSTGGGDAAYDVDFPAEDHVLVAQIRKKGGIIFAKAVNTEYNGRAGNPGGRHKPDKVLPSVLGYQRSSWAGNPSNPYDTTRAASLGSSSGSGVSVSANLCMISLGEETRASCRGPSNHNSIALILPHKAMIGFDGGAIGADIYCDRTGVHARKIADAAKVLDALKDPEAGYYDPRDPFTTVPRSSVLATPYLSHAKGSGEPGALAGVRLGVVRESMLAAGSKAAEPIVAAAAAEMKAVLKDHLGATLVESTDPKWQPDPDLEVMKVDFRKALARLVPVFMPDLMFRLKADGTPLFKEFADAIQPTEFMPGKTFGAGTMTPIDYLVAMADGVIEPPSNLDIATVQQQELATSFRFHLPQYLTRRARDWKAKGVTETLVNFEELNRRSKFWGDDQRAAFLNWQETSDPRNPLDGRQGVNERIMLRELLRRTDMMVILENRLDAFVRLHTPLPPAKIGGANEPGTIQNLRQESFYGPNGGLTEVLIPAGFVRTVYDPVLKLNAEGTAYVPTLSDVPTELPAPGLPFSFVFRAEPGKEDIILRVASSYENASKRRVPPPAFGPIPMRR